MNDDLIDLLQEFAESPDPDGQLANRLSSLQMAIHAILLFSNFEPRLLAACALARLEAAEGVLPMLIDGFRSADEAHKVYAAYACRSLGPAAAPAVPVLTTLLTHENEVVVQHSIQALAAIGSASAPAVPTLVTLLQKIDQDSLAIDVAHAWAATAALGAIGPAAHNAIPALRKCLALEADCDELVEALKLEAAESLKRINTSLR